MKCKYCLYYWPFMRAIHQSQMFWKYLSCMCSNLSIISAKHEFWLLTKKCMTYRTSDINLSTSFWLTNIRTLPDLSWIQDPEPKIEIKELSRKYGLCESCIMPNGITGVQWVEIHLLVSNTFYTLSQQNTTECKHNHKIPRRLVQIFLVFCFHPRIRSIFYYKLGDWELYLWIIPAITPLM